VREVRNVGLFRDHRQGGVSGHAPPAHANWGVPRHTFFCAFLCPMPPCALAGLRVPVGSCGRDSRWVAPFRLSSARPRGDALPFLQRSRGWENEEGVFDCAVCRICVAWVAPVHDAGRARRRLGLYILKEGRSSKSKWGWGRWGRGRLVRALVNGRGDSEEGEGGVSRQHTCVDDRKGSWKMRAREGRTEGACP
jgi:hypothetical protein